MKSARSIVISVVPVSYAGFAQCGYIRQSPVFLTVIKTVPDDVFVGYGKSPVIDGYRDLSGQRFIEEGAGADRGRALAFKSSADTEQGGSGIYDIFDDKQVFPRRALPHLFLEPDPAG